MKKIITSTMLAFMLCLCATAETKQTITINGSTVDKVATQLTFNGDNVVLHFNDGTSSEADMNDVTVSFTMTTGINDVQTFSYKGIVGGNLVVGNVEKGMLITIYNASGVQVASKMAESAVATINIENLPSGVYILKADKQAVKFIKR